MVQLDQCLRLHYKSKKDEAMNKTDFLKRRYADMRYGQAQLAVMIGLINFLLISYNFSMFKDFIEFHWYVLIAINIFGVGLIVLGKGFRIKQMSTDHNLAFVQAPLDRKTDKIILENLLAIKKHLNLKISDESIEFLELLKKIEKRK